MGTSVRSHTLPPSRAVRLWLFACCCLLLTSIAWAGAFDTPLVNASDFDTTYFSQYVDGSTTTITGTTPSTFVWTQGTTHMRQIMPFRSVCSL